jgi:bisanhydrobacterioruberin hydratase
MKNSFEINKPLWATRIFLVIFFTVGVLGFSIDATHDLFQRLVPVNLLVSTILLFLFHQKWEIRQIIIFAGIAIAGFLVEMLGIHTGVLFGSYSYGSALGLKLFSTPLMIGVNWLLLVYCIYATFPGINKKWYFPFLGAALLVIYDFVMEPVAIATDMWSWQGGEIPLKNYITWYVVATLMIFTLQLFRVSYSNKLAGWLLAIQFLFFLILSFIL